MKIKEIRDLSIDELKQKDADLVEELFSFASARRRGSWIPPP